MSASTIKTCDRYVLERQIVDKIDGYVQGIWLKFNKIDRGFTRQIAEM